VPGNVGVLADTIGYNRYDGDEVYVCTLVSWSTADGGPQTWEYDADTETGGVQCDRAVTIQL
jgi:hypothetical protein